MASCFSTTGGTGKFTTNDSARAHVGVLPASTYKVPHSLIALETGVVADETTVIPWNGEQHFLDVWEQDLPFSLALRYSCVPCYRAIAREIGATRMRTWVDRLTYGDMRFDSATVDGFWLRGASAVSPAQQVDFLRRLHDGRLDASARSQSLVREMIVLDTIGRTRLSGKTGWAIREDAPDIGWFVGYVERGRDVTYFATLIFPREDFAMAEFPGARRAITEEALRALGHYE